MWITPRIWIVPRWTAGGLFVKEGITFCISSKATRSFETPIGVSYWTPLMEASKLRHHYARVVYDWVVTEERDKGNPLNIVYFDFAKVSIPFFQWLRVKLETHGIQRMASSVGRSSGSLADGKTTSSDEWGSFDRVRGSKQCSSGPSPGTTSGLSLHWRFESRRRG